MDSLSISVSALTIVAAIDQSVTCVRKLSAIRKAPAELSALLVEVSGLHAVLLLVAAAYEEEEKRCSKEKQFAEGRGADGAKLDRQVQANLERHSGRAAQALDDLNRMACDYSSGIHSGKTFTRGLAALSCMQKGRRRALELREQLNEVRLNILTTLGVKSRYILFL